MTHALTHFPTRTQVKMGPIWKRMFDVAGASLGLVFLAPVFLASAAAIAVDSPGPVFFIQTRVGRGGLPFKIIKFRSMYAQRSRPGSQLTLSQDPRVTRVGKFLRKTKIDELPQLFNVLKGEMSLVGPRPEVPALLERYTLTEVEILTAIRPGMTDYASLLLRAEGELLARAVDPNAFYHQRLVPMKAALCARYLRTLSPAIDLGIILSTICALVLERPFFLPSDLVDATRDFLNDPLSPDPLRPPSRPADQSCK